MAAFDYVKPASMETLLNDLAQVRSEGAILAGGTDLLVQIRSGLVSRRVIFDVNDLEEMHGISDQGDSIWIGAAVRIVDVAESSLIQSAIPCLSIAASQLGSPQIRNRATLGGNILTASPAADTVPPLIAMGATVRFRSSEGVREVSIENLMKEPGQTDIHEGEVLIDVVVPKLINGCKSYFIKVGRRKAAAISVVNMAGWVKRDKTGIIEELRVVLGAVAPTAIRAIESEAFLKGKRPNQDVVKEAARIAAGESSPISDIRGTEEGRRLLVEAWTFRLLQALVS